MVKLDNFLRLKNPSSIWKSDLKCKEKNLVAFYKKKKKDDYAINNISSISNHTNQTCWDIFMGIYK
jgi:hypothetical protein